MVDKINAHFSLVEDADRIIDKGIAMGDPT